MKHDRTRKQQMNDPTVDYPEYWEEYGDKVDPATAEFLKLAAAETREATLVSEILSVVANELGERAIA